MIHPGGMLALGPALLAAASAERWVQMASLVGPLGINPFFALAGMGAAAHFEVWRPPGGLEVVGHPGVWGSLLALALVLQLGRSTKLTKPVAEVLGTGESVLGMVAFALAVGPMLEVPAGLREAGLGSGVLLVVVGTFTLGVVIAVRTALDILIWLSPIPVVDFAFQMVKTGLTIGLLALSLLSPWAALAVNILLVAAALLVLRWSVRATRFGLTLVGDATWGRLRAPVQMPRDPIDPGDLGPFRTFVVEAPGLAKRTQGALRLEAGRWVLATPSVWGRGREHPLGEAARSHLTRGRLAVELHTPGGRLILPGRYRHLVPELEQELGAAPGPGLLPAGVPAG